MQWCKVCGKEEHAVQRSTNAIDFSFMGSSLLPCELVGAPRESGWVGLVAGQEDGCSRGVLQSATESYWTPTECPMCWERPLLAEYPCTPKWEQYWEFSAKKVSFCFCFLTSPERKRWRPKFLYSSCLLYSHRESPSFKPSVLSLDFIFPVFSSRNPWFTK